MKREEVSKELIEISKKHNNILAELPTGFGKSKCALNIIKGSLKSEEKIKVLIVVPRNVLKEEWKKEIEKWKMNKSNIEYIFTTYSSLHKYGDNWKFVIFDEAHHISERCMEILKNSYNIEHSILLSATVSQKSKENFQSIFQDLYLYKINIKEAIENKVLPDPKVYLIPLELNKNLNTEVIVKNPMSRTKTIDVLWKDRWKYMNKKDIKIQIHCTEYQYIEYLDSMIEWLKKRYYNTRNEFIKRKWLRLCSDRLKWLSDKKTPIIKSILKDLNSYRTLTFCNNIEQTEILGKYCINSKNKESLNNLDKFNSGEIKHITSCNMLNEGMNLVNCRIGIYANLNSSELLIKQRLGRILRHKEPVIIIPYYKNTREQELVEKMIEDYNKELIMTIEYSNKIKI